MAVAGNAAGLIQRPLHPLQHCTTLKFQLGSPTLESGEQENSHGNNFSGTNRFALCSGLCKKSLNHLSAKLLQQASMRSFWWFFAGSEDPRKRPG